ncbi:redoxin domain-containing protein [Actinoplanes sp. G11-F43]|uniref:redoxin domain-containing protein n=1 Tax=Actinoplanes sp. G11-F43 TaxID=3424130 RepID=UPI003D325178
MTTVHDLRRVDHEAFQQLLDRNAIWKRMVAAGDRLPPHPLYEVDLGPVHPARLLATGPLVLVFVRYAGSPACDAALRSYQGHLQPELDRLGAHLVAVSPQAPNRLAAVKHREELGYLVTSDPRHVLIDALNIGFGNPGADVVLGTGRSVLPFAAAVVVDRTGVVRFAEVRPNWSDPVPPGRLIAAVQSLPGITAAT